jgi:hypothetical protein
MDVLPKRAGMKNNSSAAARQDGRHTETLASMITTSYI